MSEPARELPIERLPFDSVAMKEAVGEANRGVITHLTLHGERVAAIVPESLIDRLRDAEDIEDAAEADTAMGEPGDDLPWEHVKAELGL